MRKPIQDIELVNNLMEGMPPLISCKQAQGLLNISRASIYRLVDKGYLDKVSFNMANTLGGKKGGKPTMRITNTSIRNLLIQWLTKE
jgi:predicted DNA-binding transcriptional regulator AlpA